MTAMATLICLWVVGLFRGVIPKPPAPTCFRMMAREQFTVVQTPFSAIGMVTDARWTDMDNDGRADLVLCGEFMPVKVYHNTTGWFH